MRGVRALGINKYLRKGGPDARCGRHGNHSRTRCLNKFAKGPLDMHTSIPFLSFRLALPADLVKSATRRNRMSSGRARLLPRGGNRIPTWRDSGRASPGTAEIVY